jgi:hypothetical protein
MLMLGINYAGSCQTSLVPLKEWVKKLDNPSDIENKGVEEISKLIFSKDTATAKFLLAELKKKGVTAGTYFKTRILWLQAKLESKLRYPDGVAEVSILLEKAMKEAYKTGDDYLIANISWDYGSIMYEYQQIELAATNFLKAAELQDRLHFKLKYIDKLILGEVLFHSREYERSIFYNHEAESSSASPGERLYYRLKALNTIGQCYQQLQQPDSAMLYYNRSYTIAKKIGHETWKGINSLFLGQLFLAKKEYSRAKPLFNYAYRTNNYPDYTIAAGSLQGLATVYLVQGKTDSAKICLTEAFRLLQIQQSFKKFQKENYLQQVYRTAAELYRMLGNTDSFYHYHGQYSRLHDSLEKVVALSSIKMSQLRINNEKNGYAILALQNQKSKEEQKRNFIIAFICVVALSIIIMLNRQKKILKYKEELALYQQKVAQAETEAARQQLNLFTENMREKTALLQNLQQQLNDKTATKEQQQWLTQLSNETILTEDDWIRFKSLFEKIYPGFFIKLKETSIHITVAEQRMAALSRLHLTPKEMAAMLGISLESVQKTRQRLRQRLQLSVEKNMNEYLAQL